MTRPEQLPEQGVLLARLVDEIAGQLERRTAERDSHEIGSKEWFYVGEQANTLKNVLSDMRYALENGVTQMESMRAVALNSPLPQPAPEALREALREALESFVSICPELIAVLRADSRYKRADELNLAINQARAALNAPSLSRPAALATPDPARAQAEAEAEAEVKEKNERN